MIVEALPAGLGKAGQDQGHDGGDQHAPVGDGHKTSLS
jgi:hypothetical protein